MWYFKPAMSAMTSIKIKYRRSHAQKSCNPDTEKTASGFLSSKVTFIFSVYADC